MVTDDVKKSQDRLLKVKSSERTKWSNQAIEDRAFVMNVMWSSADEADMKARGQVAPIVNELIPTTYDVVAAFTANSPKFFCVGRDKSDNKVASDTAALFSWIWYISNGNSKFRTFATDYEHIGMGGLMAYTDPFADNNKGEIYITDVDPLELYIDPNSKLRDASDAAYIQIVKRISKEQLSIMYPDFNFDGAVLSHGDDYPTSSRSASMDQVLRTADLPSDVKYEVIDEYSKIKVKRFHVYDPSSNFEKTFETEDEYIQWANEPAIIITELGKTTYTTDPKQVEQLMSIIRQYGTVYHLEQDPMSPQSPPKIVSGAEVFTNPYNIKASTRKLDAVPIATLLEKKYIKYTTPTVDRIKRVFSIGLKEYANYIIPRIKDYPIVTGMLYQNRNPFPMGDIRLVKNLQEELNKIDNLIITYHQNIANLSFFVPKGSGQKKEMEERAGQTGQKVFEYDPELGGTPIMLQYMQMGSSFFAYRQSIIQQIQRIIGSYTFMDSQLTTPRTAEGTQVIDEVMQRRTASKKRDIEDTINQLAKVISQMIPTVYTERKVVRLIQPNHNPIEVIFNDPQVRDDGSIELLNDLSQFEFDVQMQSGSTLPTNKAQQRAELLQGYQIGMLKDPKWWIEKTDFENVDEVLEGESRLKQAEQMIEQLNQQMKDMGGQLQRKSAEVIQANEKVAITKTQQELKTISNQAKSNVLLSNQRLNDFVKEKKQEVNQN